MIVKTLVENNSINNDLRCEHGLSLYLELKDKKILFDVGASNIFVENAKILGVDIADIDYLVLSHGHNDHGGGLEVFLEENDKAEIFIHRNAFDRHYSMRDYKPKYIGFDPRLKNDDQIIYTTDRFFINNDIEVFADVDAKVAKPKSNINLYKSVNGVMVHDDFSHEQNLIIQEDGKYILVSGCSHNGIINIIEKFKELKGTMPDYVIGGFHLYSRSSGSESIENIDKLAEYLLNTKTQYYTLHCTGQKAYDRMKIIMGNKIQYLKTGSKIEI